MVGEGGSSRWEDDDGIRRSRSSGSCGKRIGCWPRVLIWRRWPGIWWCRRRRDLRWRNQYGGLKANDAKRLKELERERRRLKKIVAEKELEIDAAGEIARTKLVSPSQRRRAVWMLQDRLGLCAGAGVPDRRAAPFHPTPHPSRPGS